MLDEEGELAEVVEGRIANIFFIFSQAENHVKEMVAERTVLHRTYPNAALVQILTCLRGLERTETHDASPPDNHAEVYQEPFDAINDARLPSEFECHRCIDRPAEVNDQTTSFPRGF